MTNAGGERAERGMAPGATGRALGEALASSAIFLRWTLAVLAAAYLLSGIFVVGPEEEAVVLTFGRLEEDGGKLARGPGIHFALPSPFQEVVRFQTRRVCEITINTFSRSASVPGSNGDRRDEAGGGGSKAEETAKDKDKRESERRRKEKRKPEDPGAANELPDVASIEGLDPVSDGYLISADMNLLRASIVVRWRVSDLPRHMFEHARTAEVLRAAVESAAIAAVGGIAVDELLGEGREKARARMLELAQRASDRLGLGVEIVSLDMPLLEPPAFLAGAFREVNAARVEAKGLADEARAYREQNLEAAAAEANRMIKSAEGYRAEKIARARGETKRFLALLARYRTDPEVFGKRMYAEAVEQILENVAGKVILPPGTDRFAVRLLLDAPAAAPAAGQPREGGGTARKDGARETGKAGAPGGAAK